jgi:lysophospholipase L1-like esterase
MGLRKELLLLALMPGIAVAQAFDFDMTKKQPVYSQEIGYGYDVVAAPDKKKPNAPYFFSVKVDDGNYRVRVVLGSKKRVGETTVRAEGRRLMVHNVMTKKGQFETFEFQVNKRSPRIDDKSSVRIKDREKEYLAWDEKLTLEFNGDAPTVQSIHIERDDQVPTIYLCGNSTVVDQNNEPWASWGQMITRWFGPEVAVSNHAESGLTARTFIAGGRLDKILTTLHKGDLLIAEFGHNDEKEKRAGDGAWYHYVYNLKIFVDQVRSKGADIVFCTPTQRRAFDKDGKTIMNTHGEFPAAMMSVAEREKVLVIDLNKMTKQFFETLGYEDSKRALVHYPKELYGRELADNTHFNPYGAYEVAKCVVMGMKQLQLPIVKYLRPEWQDFDPAQPDDWRTFKWVESPLKDIVKPDGN